MAIKLTLKSLLAIDALTCAGMGALLMLAAEPLAALTDLPAPFLLGAGAVLLPIAAFMTLVAHGRPISPTGARLVMAGNIGWVVASVALPALGLIQPNPLGWAFLIAQATVVAVLARLEAQAMRARLAMA